MLRRAAATVAGAVAVLLVVVTIIFFALRFVPGDPALAIVGGGGSAVDEEVLDAVRVEYGLDLPLSEQYLLQLGRLVRADFGTSYALKQDVATVIGQQLGSTLVLASLALVTAWLIAAFVAVASSRGGRLGRGLASAFEIVSAALPHFWLASVLIVVLAVQLRWFPATSSGSGLVNLVLPVITLAIPLAGFLGQVMREALLDALEAPFSLSARARGESEIGLRMTHALRHALIPAIGLSGWAFGSLMSGAVVVESVFAREGLGRTLLAAVLVRDIPVVIGVLVTVAAVYIVVNILGDMFARLADPRIAQHAT